MKKYNGSNHPSTSNHSTRATLQVHIYPPTKCKLEKAGLGFNKSEVWGTGDSVIAKGTLVNMWQVYFVIDSLE